MTSDRWNKVQELFEAALDQPPAQRRAYLRDACAGDEALLHEVVSLLDEDRHTHSLLDGVALDAIAVLDELSQEGRHVGPYRLLRQLGQGGMGTVYLALRADGQFDQQVALKLVKRGMDSDQILRRFRAERQILARLHHPNIARLLDGGLTDQGQPYFVMEYVDGLPIDVYCDEHRLSIDDRLALFQQVCKAVLYAHANLVVHRDLKPSNILVTGDPGSGPGQARVKLLDFGIAKVLEDDEEAALTRTGSAVMTPEYASPEQVRGEAAGTSTDIYSLGVVLYELLTGVRPYVLASRSPVEAARVISEVEPERPSTAVARSGQAGAETTGTTASSTITRARSTEAGRLRRRLSGDLDVICLKALKKEPSRRYGSVEALVEDLRRHLAGLPVEARPDTVGYRARKFVKRHRLGVASAALAAALVATVVGFYTVRLAQERDRARVEAEKAAQVSAFLQGIFEVSDPSASKGETVTARSLLEAGAARVEEELADQPAVQAQMMQVIGAVYHSLGLYDEATPFHERALEIRNRLYGPDHPDVAAGMNALARALEARGAYDDAERLHRDALAVQKRLLGEDHPSVAESLDDLGWIRYRKGDYEGAEALYRDALALRQQRSDEAHPDLAQSFDNVAKALHAKGDYEAAEAFYRDALAFGRAAHGEEHREVATTMSNLANLLRFTGQRDEAERLHRKALAVRRTLLGPDHPHVTSSLNSLAVLLHGMGRYDEAEPLFREALALRRQRLGDEHPQVAVPLTGLAALLRDKGDTDEAERLFRESLALHRKTLPEGHANIAHPLMGLGDVLAGRGAHEQAEPYLREAYQIRRQALPEGHWRIARAAGALGGCLADLHRYADAEPLLTEGYDALKAARGADDRLTQQALGRLIALYDAWNKPAEADRYRALLRADE